MSLQDQTRNAAIRNRKNDKLREESALGRAAQDVGMTISEATTHNWKSHTT
ncbi:hypothetical protein H6F42_02170 [Pseudanabaena sp. FACHB-1998]|uniref:hypothetical protein n=1 Tax=Pseudanabaena sp. FACHB-1998 TaxID=2692858 RepID=UPI0016812E4E|nr:hypothetical protein [Pseudanabaena sp. FACHB-1998]MBD2175725.1 hypothetical protein [Pseudanabaena sp. FACHB-1998]